MNVPRPGWRAGLLLAAALTLASAGCTNDKSTSDPGPASPSTTASPTPSVDTSSATAQQLAIAAYHGYISSWAIASQQADPGNPDLARYVADPLLSLTQHNVQKLKDSGEQQVGAQKATVLSSKVDLAATQPVVTIHACLDYSDLKLIYTKNKSPVPNSEIKNKKLSTIATVWLYKNDQWLVNKVDGGKDPC